MFWCISGHEFSEPVWSSFSLHLEKDEEVLPAPKVCLQWVIAPKSSRPRSVSLVLSTDIGNRHVHGDTLGEGESFRPFPSVKKNLTTPVPHQSLSIPCK